MTDTSHLNPNQRRIIEDLLAAGDLVRPRFDDSLAPELRDKLERDLRPFADLLEFGGFKSVNKFALYQVHACEGLHAAQDQAEFEWSIAAVRGRVAHKAIELSFASPGIAPPLDLIDTAVQILQKDDVRWGPGEFLRSLSPFEIAQLKGESNDAVVKFFTDWPPIDRRWYPRVESSVAVSLCDERIKLRGKYDLAFGRPSGNEARVIIVDFKTGGQYPRYSEDLRFYALLETLRTGIPPFRIASYYLESGTFTSEDVNEDVLNAAVRRTVDGVRKILEVGAAKREPILLAGSWCRFCPARLDCEVGVAFLAGSGNGSGSPD